MKAIIEVNVPDFQIDQEVNIYFKDTMMIKGIVQEPKTGRWIWEIDETPSTPVSPYELNYAGWVCSCCHEFPDDICEWDDPDEPPTYKFCPNCGAKMESEG